MIIRVQFLPAEAWPSCHRALAGKFAGLIIEIDTNRPVDTPCGGRGWMASASSKEMIERILNVETAMPHNWWVCEHVLAIGD